jgi:hypothetical protein
VPTPKEALRAAVIDCLNNEYEYTEIITVVDDAVSEWGGDNE